MKYQELGKRVDALLLEPPENFDSVERRCEEETALRELCLSARTERLPEAYQERLDLATKLLCVISHMGIPTVHLEILQYFHFLTRDGIDRMSLVASVGWVIATCTCGHCVGYHIGTAEMVAAHLQLDAAHSGIIRTYGGAA